MRNLLSLLGFCSTIVLLVGYLYKSDYRLVQVDRPAGAGPLALQDQSGTDDRHAEETLRLDLDSDRPATARNWSEREYPSAATGRRATEKSAAASRLTFQQLDGWVDRHRTVAVMEALDRGVPAGISLAVGLHLLQQGTMTERDDFATRVVDRLSRLRDNAATESRTHFRFFANSGEWARGLEREGHFSESELLAILQEFNLSAYDSEVYLALQERDEKDARRPVKTHRASVWPSAGTEEAAENESLSRAEVADEGLRRNMAYSMNRLADMKLEEQNAQSHFRESRRPAREVLSRAQQQAAELQPGQQLKFEKVTEFQAVLREVLALEAGYGSWEDYLAAEADKARAIFARRSDILANGGRLIVERKN